MREKKHSWRKWRSTQRNREPVLLERLIPDHGKYFNTGSLITFSGPMIKNAFKTFDFSLPIEQAQLAGSFSGLVFSFSWPGGKAEIILPILQRESPDQGLGIDPRSNEGVEGL